MDVRPLQNVKKKTRRRKQGLKESNVLNIFSFGSDPELLVPGSVSSPDLTEPTGSELLRFSGSLMVHMVPIRPQTHPKDQSDHRCPKCGSGAICGP